MEKSIQILENRISRLEEMRTIKSGNEQKDVSLSFMADMKIQIFTEAIELLKAEL